MSGKKLDLSKCELGDKLMARNGKVFTFSHITSDGFFPIITKEGDTFRADGKYQLFGDNELDNVKILSKERKQKTTAKPAPKPDLPPGVFRVSDLVGKTLVIEGSRNDGTFKFGEASVLGAYNNEKEALEALCEESADVFESDSGNSREDLENWGSDALIVEVRRVVRPVPKVSVKCGIKVIAGGENAR